MPIGTVTMAWIMVNSVRKGWLCILVADGNSAPSQTNKIVAFLCHRQLLRC